MNLKSIYGNFVCDEVFEYGERILKGLKGRFECIDEIAEYNQQKVLKAMQDAHVGEASLGGTSGYGYNDIGRDAVELTYAKAFGTEDALVRPQIICGTHALTVALSGNLKPGDELLYISGMPYDTLHEVIGIREAKGSLADYGVSFDCAELTDDGHFDYEAIKNKIKPNTRLIGIQRSRGYSTRPTLSVEEIGDVIDYVKRLKPDVKVMVDNCYGEFTETIEPSQRGADMIVGSLIKNPGGGLAPVGGYIAGTKECVENASYRLSAPGLGKELGPTLGLNKNFLQGFFLAPTVTAGAEKGAIFAAAVYEKLGYSVNPSSDAPRYDIIQAVTFNDPDAVIAFCRGIQAAAPVDSYVVPEPWDMPGYDDPVIMAAGAFVSGSSIELSADGPMRAPYTVYFQGGLTFYHAKMGILMSLQKLCDAGIVDKSRLCSL